MKSRIIPTMRYRDAAGMVDWLHEAFGFEKLLVVEDGSGGVAHVELTFAIMLGSARDDDFGKLQRTPTALGGTTHSPYIIVPDADALYGRAKAAGAEIVIEIKDEDYGGRGFSCRDPEGHLWNFGTYDPWKQNA